MTATSSIGVKNAIYICPVFTRVCTRKPIFCSSEAMITGAEEDDSFLHSQQAPHAMINFCHTACPQLISEVLHCSALAVVASHLHLMQCTTTPARRASGCPWNCAHCSTHSPRPQVRKSSTLSHLNRHIIPIR